MEVKKFFVIAAELEPRGRITQKAFPTGVTLRFVISMSRNRARDGAPHKYGDDHEGVRRVTRGAMHL